MEETEDRFYEDWSQLSTSRTIEIRCNLLMRTIEREITRLSIIGKSRSQARVRSCTWTLGNSRNGYLLVQDMEKKKNK